MTIRATLITMRKNPKRVTILGASHSGSSSTKAFHCRRERIEQKGQFFFFGLLYNKLLTKLTPSLERGNSKDSYSSRVLDVQDVACQREKGGGGFRVHRAGECSGI